jgi:hypothetical protein
VTGILQQARAEGYRDGVGQMATVCQDDAFAMGRAAGWADARGGYWAHIALAFVAGAVLSATVLLWA